MKIKFPRIEKGLLVILTVVLVVGFLTMPAQEYPGDAVAVRIETANFIRTGHFGVPTEVAVHFGDRGQYFYNNEKTGEWFPKYGIMNTLIYAPALWVESTLGGNTDSTGRARVLTLNIHNLIIMISCAALFYLMARLFSKSQFCSAFYSLSVIFATFCWNYFRAQTFEAHQVLFFGVALYSMIIVIRGFNVGSIDKNASDSLGRWLLVCALMLNALMLCKSLYILLIPVFGAALLAALGTYGFIKVRPVAWKTILVSFCGPCAVGFILLLAVNQHKFGSPFNTGYTQWVREEHLFSGDFLKGLLGYLFDGQFGVFLCFPLLLLSLFYWRQFLLKYPLESLLFLLSAATLLLINACFINWKGAWCYGPRYLLPILPFISLPIIMFFDGNWQRPWNYQKSLCSLPVMFLIILSFLMQTRINELPFFTYYQTLTTLVPPPYLKISEFYFQNSMPIISSDLNKYKKTGQLPPIEELEKQLNSEQRMQLRTFLWQYLQSNYFWSR
jgi:hypothetical protein